MPHRARLLGQQHRQGHPLRTNVLAELGGLRQLSVRTTGAEPFRGLVRNMLSGQLGIILRRRSERVSYFICATVRHSPQPSYQTESRTPATTSRGDSVPNKISLYHHVPLHDKGSRDDLATQSNGNKDKGLEKGAKAIEDKE
jgi:hypothetical protein